MSETIPDSLISFTARAEEFGSNVEWGRAKLSCLGEGQVGGDAAVGTRACSRAYCA